MELELQDIKVRVDEFYGFVVLEQHGEVIDAISAQDAVALGNSLLDAAQALSAVPPSRGVLLESFSFLADSCVSGDCCATGEGCASSFVQLDGMSTAED
jgi:hypothetical protein